MNLPDNEQFVIVYADPPWNYRDRMLKHGGAERHYPTMTTKQIAALPVADIVAKDAFLFLWATFPNLPAALEIMKAWNFTYKTAAFTWIKTNPISASPCFGAGHYTRANAEVCLLGVRGRPTVVSHSVQSAIIHPRGRHSQKPDEARDRIVQLCGDVPRIELFARTRADGWTSWGNEI